MTAELAAEGIDLLSGAEQSWLRVTLMGDGVMGAAQMVVKLAAEGFELRCVGFNRLGYGCRCRA